MILHSYVSPEGKPSYTLDPKVEMNRSITQVEQSPGGPVLRKAVLMHFETDLEFLEFHGLP